MPPTDTPPVWVTLPPEARLRFLPTELKSKMVARVFTKVTSLAPAFCRLTLPEKALAWLRVIGLAPAAKNEGPDTVRVPDWRNSPPELRFKVPMTVWVGRTSAALMKARVRLRRVDGIANAAPG